MFVITKMTMEKSDEPLKITMFRYKHKPYLNIYARNLCLYLREIPPR